ncbi:MAG: PQQ-binding-like beta-propeller repeat protein [Planctomycetes bacterium]|nr:PQQ-binding-like beta-propeller repeat protein [Planctomycetota bacterium]
MWIRCLAMLCLCGIAACSASDAPAAPGATSKISGGVTAWAIYRGDEAMHGVSKAKLPADPVLKWSYKTEGPVKSSPVIADGRIFIGSDSKQLLALDAMTGKLLWSFMTEDTVEAPPTIDGDAVYIGSTDTNLYKLDAATGKLAWKFATNDKIIGAAVAVDDAASKRRLVLIGSYDGTLHALNAADGKEVWHYETSDPINGSAAIHNGVAAFGGCDGSLHIVDLDNGSERRTIEIGSIVAATPALDGDMAYVGHFGNEFVAANVNTGDIAWRYKDRNFEYRSSAAVTDELVVFGGRDRRLHCLHRADGSVKWLFSARGKIDSSPVIADGHVVVGSADGRLYIVDLAEGKQTWSYEIGEAISGSPAVIDGLIVIGAEDGVVYAFGDKP